MKVGNTNTLLSNKYTTHEEALKNISSYLKSYYVFGAILGRAPLAWNRKPTLSDRISYVLHWIYFILILILYIFLMLHNLWKIYLEGQKPFAMNKMIILLAVSILQIQFYQSLIFSLLTRHKLVSHLNWFASADVAFLRNGTTLNFSERVKKRNYLYFSYVSLSILVKFGLLLSTLKIDAMQKITLITASLGKSYVQHLFIILSFQNNLRLDKVNRNIGAMMSNQNYKQIGMNDIKIIKEVTDKLYQLCRMHYKLCYLMREINKTFAFQLLCSLAVSMGDVLFQSYYLYYLLFSNVPDISVAMILCPIVWLFDEMLEIYLLVHSCASTCDSANTTPILLHELRNQLDNIEIESHIQMYSLQLLHQKVHVSALGFFDIDYSLIYSIVGVLTTYLVIFIQFDQQNSDVKLISGNSGGNCSIP